MRQIIYVSSSASIMTPEALETIAAQARVNNPRDQITGMLLYGDQLFFQVLEGPDDQIASMSERIWNDPRHNGIREFKNEPVDARSFPDWSMGCYRVDTLCDRDGNWPIVDADSISQHLPDAISFDVTVLARTFFQSIARH